MQHNTALYINFSDNQLTLKELTDPGKRMTLEQPSNPILCEEADAGCDSLEEFFQPSIPVGIHPARQTETPVQHESEGGPAIPTPIELVTEPGAMHLCTEPCTSQRTDQGNGSVQEAVALGVQQESRVMESDVSPRATDYSNNIFLKTEGKTLRPVRERRMTGRVHTRPYPLGKRNE